MEEKHPIVPRILMLKDGFFTLKVSKPLRSNSPKALSQLIHTLVELAQPVKMTMMTSISLALMTKKKTPKLPRSEKKDWLHMPRRNRKSQLCYALVDWIERLKFRCRM